MGEPWVELMGLPETGRSGTSVVEVMEADLVQALATMKEKVLTDDDALEDELKRLARKTAVDEIGRKPEVVVVISRLA